MSLEVRRYIGRNPALCGFSLESRKAYEFSDGNVVANKRRGESSRESSLRIEYPDQEIVGSKLNH